MQKCGASKAYEAQLKNNEIHNHFCYISFVPRSECGINDPLSALCEIMLHSHQNHLILAIALKRWLYRCFSPLGNCGRQQWCWLEDWPVDNSGKQQSLIGRQLPPDNPGSRGRQQRLWLIDAPAGSAADYAVAADN